MPSPRRTERPLLTLAALAALAVPSTLALVRATQSEPDFGTVFDEHWENLRKDYPFFERYGVDWDAEREEHRPRAVAAENATEFAWELARLLSGLQDTHVSLIPSPDILPGWSYPVLRTATLDRKAYVIGWPEGQDILGPDIFRDDPRAYPEIVEVQETPIGCGVEILAAGPLGSVVDVRLRWPDGSETVEELQRPKDCNLPPPKKHFGERWIVSGRVGSIGYLRVKTFSPELGTLGPAGKMTPILREHLKELGDTDSLILDVQSNGGGLVAASDPFLSHFLEQRQSYQWGNSNGQKRTLVPRSPRYRGEVVVLVDEKSASGGEWAARILRDAGRATVIGGRTQGAEAAVKKSVGSDGSMIQFSAWPMIEPGVASFQDRGVMLDHALPLTIEDVREHGYEQALDRIRRQRFTKALETLGAPPEDLEAIMALANEADAESDKDEATEH